MDGEVQLMRGAKNKVRCHLARCFSHTKIPCVVGVQARRRVESLSVYECDDDCARGHTALDELKDVDIAGVVQYQVCLSQKYNIPKSHWNDLNTIHWKTLLRCDTP